MASNSPILVVGGNVATGKTGLIVALSKSLALPAFLERWDQNPWFDSDPGHRFGMQLWFLVAAAEDHARMALCGGIQERCIQEHAHVFAREQLHDADATLMESVFARLESILPAPNLLLYLTASVPELYNRVRNRGREQENGLTIAKLQRLQTLYDALISGWERCPVIEIDTEAVDLRSAAGLSHVVSLTSEVQL
jgi:deoxyadenosine/deoxycytidine kinase